MEAAHPTIESAIWQLWELCLITARKASLFASALGVDSPVADAVQDLIRQSRAIIRDEGCSDYDSDMILFDVYTAIHWDWRRPTDRVFETMLEFELARFFKDRKVH